MPSGLKLLVAASVLTAAFCVIPAAHAENNFVPLGLSAPVYRGTRGAPHFPQENMFARALLPQPHVNPVGQPCVELHPAAEAQAINRNIYDHNLLIDNQCSQTIRLWVCYYRSRTCSIFPIAGYRRQLKLFGISPERDFRIEYREYLD